MENIALFRIFSGYVIGFLLLYVPCFPLVAIFPVPCYLVQNGEDSAGKDDTSDVDIIIDYTKEAKNLVVAK